MRHPNTPSGWYQRRLSEEVELSILPGNNEPLPHPMPNPCGVSELQAEPELPLLPDGPSLPH